MPKTPVPDFVKAAPQSELAKRLGLAEPKRYYHHPFCSADPYKPPGSPGCPCLRWLRNLDLP